MTSIHAAKTDLPTRRFNLEFEGWPDIDQILSHFSIFWDQLTFIWNKKKLLCQGKDPTIHIHAKCSEMDSSNYHKSCHTSGCWVLALHSETLTSVLGNIMWNLWCNCKTALIPPNSPKAQPMQLRLQVQHNIATYRPWAALSPNKWQC
jgi:hypothetical protein